MTQPTLDETLVRRLSEIAAMLDGGDALADRPLLDEFNRLAETNIPFSEFQGVSGGQEHIDYARRVLTAAQTPAVDTLSRDELVEMFTRILDDPSDSAYLAYVFTTIEKTFADSQVSDLVFWPGIYFGDGDNARERSPKEMADAVIARHGRRSPQ